MPYKNIHWIKLKFLDLLTDPEHRFIEKLNDEQKGLYLMMLILMGFYHNQIPLDPKTIKRTLNLTQEDTKISENIAKICEVFSRGIRKSHIIKFKNYNKLHNPLRNAQGTPKEGLEKSRVEKRKIDKIIYNFLEIKQLSKEPNDISYAFRRWGRAARDLALLSKEEDCSDVIEAIKVIGEKLDKKGYSWTLETVLKWFPEFKVKGKTEAYDQLLEKFDLKEKR